jgi:hypothetical protein
VKPIGAGLGHGLERLAAFLRLALDLLPGVVRLACRERLPRASVEA